MVPTTIYAGSECFLMRVSDLVDSTVSPSLSSNSYPETVDAICDWLQERRAANASGLNPAPMAALESSWQSSVGSNISREVSSASTKSRL